jgi:hypothetical protein
MASRYPVPWSDTRHSPAIPATGVGTACTPREGMSMAARNRTPAQLYALVFGAVLVVVGILGFISDASFGSGDDVDGSDFIVFEVNGWHNIVHILSGLLGLALARQADSARLYALAFGATYLVVTVRGFITSDQVLWLVS